MKNLCFLIVLAITSSSLMAQETDSLQTEKQSSSLIVETTGNTTGASYSSGIPEIDFQLTEHYKIHNTIIKNEDGYYLYTYDYGCMMTEKYDNQYFLKLFVGKTYADVLESEQTLNLWWKQAEFDDFMTTTNPDGQKVIIYKSMSPSRCLYISYGTIDDVKWLIRQVGIDTNNQFTEIIPIVNLATNSTRLSTEQSRDQYVLNKLAEGTYKLGNWIPKNTFFKAFKKFKKQKPE